MRVISGNAKGRALQAAGAATRPITDRVKENLFNILGARIVDANVLDLFAGAGSVGIEALSRGARAATFVERDHRALNAIRANLRATQLADRARVVRDDVFKFLRRATTETFDVIYVAPPQYKGLWAETLRALDGSALVAEARHRHRADSPQGVQRTCAGEPGIVRPAQVWEYAVVFLS
jgi:16S rRNA (guanine966-N2)-methyltransferase